MNIQSLSIAVPSGCPNNCKFCVSRMSKIEKNTYINQIEKNKEYRDLYQKDYINRLAYARDNGCNVILFTGTGEPLMNLDFINMVSDMNKSLDKPFRMIELQTSGIGLNDKTLSTLRNHIGITTISLSLSSLNTNKNAEYNQTPEKLKIDIDRVCSKIKVYDFNLRLSLNLTDSFSEMYYNEVIDNYSVDDLFRSCKYLGADQIIFRKLYKSKDVEIEQNKWIDQHSVHEDMLRLIHDYIYIKGNPLERLPFGAMRYSVDEMSVVLDDDCMSKEVKDSVKYFILRENCKLYTKWDDKGSLLF